MFLGHTSDVAVAALIYSSDETMHIIVMYMDSNVQQKLTNTTTRKIINLYSSFITSNTINHRATYTYDAT